MDDVQAFKIRTILGHTFPVAIGGMARYGAWLASLLIVSFSPLCLAQYGGARNPSMGDVQRGLPTYLKHAGIAQNLNRELPLSAAYVDSTGKPVILGDYFGKRPVVLAEVYFSCGMLCPQVMHGAAEALKQTGFEAGKDYNVVIASLIPTTSSQGCQRETVVPRLAGRSGCRFRRTFSHRPTILDRCTQRSHRLSLRKGAGPRRQNGSVRPLQRHYGCDERYVAAVL